MEFQSLLNFNIHDKCLKNGKLTNTIGSGICRLNEWSGKVFSIISVNPNRTKIMLNFSE